MKKRYIILMLLIFVITFLASLFLGFNYFKIKNAKVRLILNKNLNVEFNDNKKISDFIKSINGKIINDKKIDTTSLGKKNIKFTFINQENIRINYNFDINVVDTKPPLVMLDNIYTIYKNEEFNSNKILCGDIVDDKPKCNIIGSYDVSKKGKYPLQYAAMDKSGNKIIKNFTLEVKELKKEEKDKSAVDYNIIYDKYKTNKTKIGLDVSKYQKDINFEKLKKSNVDFIMIKLGEKINGEYYIDPKFEENIKNALKYDIDVGIYYFSYAKSQKEAIDDAKWVINNIKDYDIKLPVAFDWENWSNFNEYNLSFFSLTNISNAFLDTIKKNGYSTMLYSSKNYLENVWQKNNHDIWLAHYTKNLDKTTYNSNYKMWQITDRGKINGIETLVDVDILKK